MMNLFLKKKTFIWFLMVFAIILGFSSMVNLPRESMPEIKIPIVGVTTVYPGASSFDVEKLVTDPLEKQFLRTLKNVDVMHSTSGEGMSIITIQFENNVDIKEALANVRDEIDRVNNLPTDVFDPIATEFSFSDMPIFVVSLSSQEAYTQLSTTVQRVEQMFLDISGVSKVQIDGIPEREITLILDKSKLDQYGVSPSEVIQKISQSNFSMPAGSFVQNGIEYNLRVDNTLESIEDIQNIILRPLSQGKYLSVKDIGIIEDGLAPYTSLSRLSTDGSEMEQAITFSIFKQVDADITTVTHAARKKISEIQAEYPNTNFVTVIDYGKDIGDSIRDLSLTALQTILLVTLILSLGLSLKAAMVTGITVPLSFFLTFIGLQYTGTSLNFISLFALILSVGLLVDASIVIIEGITTAQEKGLNAQQAIQSTLREYAQPVIVGNLTTIVVFVPMVAMSGIIGEFIRSIPLTIILVLIASLLVALIFVPLLSTFKRFSSKKEYSWILSLNKHRERAFENLNHWYGRQLRYFFSSNTRKRKFFWSVMVMFIFFLSLLGTGVIKSEFFPIDDFKEITISVSLPQGSQISDTDTAIQELENYLREHTLVSSFVSKLYSERAEINVLIDDEKDGTQTLADIRGFISTVSKNISITALPPANGPSSGAPISIRLLGDDYDEMVKGSIHVEEILRSIPGTVDVDSSVSDNTLDIVLHLQHSQLIDTGIDGLYLSGIIRNSLFGSEATTIRRNGEDVSVMVKTAVNEDYFSSLETRHISLDQLRSIPIPTSSGTSPLGLFISESVIGNTPSIQREDGDRVVTVTSYLNNGYVLSDVIVPFTQAMNSVSLPDGVSWSFGGDAESSAAAGADLMKAVLIGMALVMSVLIYQFNSVRKTFLILSVIPLGLIGVLFGLLVLGQPLSFISMLGFVTLSALVINNSIILIDVFTKLEQQGVLQGTDAIIEGSLRRLRPILLTTVTTVIGMIPLLFTSPMWQPLAVAIIFGLLFATVITLMLIPILYSWWGNKKNRKTNE